MGKIENRAVLAPIAVFAFNRPTNLETCLESIVRCEEACDSEVTVFIDKELSDNDAKLTNGCLQVARRFSETLNLKIVCSEYHKGLANSIIDGINQIFSIDNKIIVLEDDLIVAPNFLKFCNQNLNIFEDFDSVGAICGYLPSTADGKLSEPFFLHEFSSWGWATWKNRWELFELDSKLLLDKIEELGMKNHFDMDSTYPFTAMLENQELGKIDSWAIRWRASLMVANKLTLYPNKPLVKNNGFKGIGTHSKKTNKYENNLFLGEIAVINRIEVIESAVGRESFKIFNRFLHKESVAKKIIYRLRLKFHSILQKISKH
jgi:hypothetical protein